jgi:hypothetical protein
MLIKFYDDGKQRNSVVHDLDHNIWYGNTWNFNFICSKGKV